MTSSILGVDHVGLGVRDMERMRSFYRDALGFDRVLGEMPEEDHEAIHGLLRAPKAVHRSMLLGQQNGGLTVALFHAVEPTPRPIRRDPRYGDIGVAKVTFTVRDLASFCRDRSGQISFCSSPKLAVLPGQERYFFAYGRDPEGNLLEFISESGAAVEGPVLRSVGIAVTDLERSVAFYSDALGFDKVVVAPHETFSGLVDELSGVSGTVVRSCLIETGEGRGMLELFEVTKPRGRSIPFGTQWGDFGYLQMCLYATDQERLNDQIESKQLDILLPSQPIGDPEHPATFMYLRDLDGIPVEVVIGL
jgi:catechol 2,3-dioxygenase-like lactoylglutathione lyase family enzyme